LVFFGNLFFEGVLIFLNLKGKKINPLPKNFFMTVNVHSVHFEADAKLLEHIDKKIVKLATYHDRIVAVDVFLKLDNVIHQIKDKIAEIRVQIPKHELFVKQSTKSFEESFDMALDSMLIQIKKVKEKQLV
jgi:putative sigma-54 modulation protein